MSASVASTRRPARASLLMRKLAQYVVVGGAAGFAIAVGVLFLIGVLYGESIGLSPGACALFACSITMLLSQPAGIGGMVSGAVVGLIAGAIVYHAHHHARRHG
jgi:hypothetical protein